jgi:hypothetical protein
VRGQSPYFDDDFGHDRELMRERGDLVVGRHVIRTGVDLMNVAMDSAMETQRVIGQNEALRGEVKEANVRTANEQVERTKAETQARHDRAALDRAIEYRDEARGQLRALKERVTELAASYRPGNEALADVIDRLLVEPKKDDA